MDMITLIRSATRGLLKAADLALEAEPRCAMWSDDDDASAAKPQIDWNDNEAQAPLIDSRAEDAYACFAHLDGSELGPAVEHAAHLLATVVGQDLDVALGMDTNPDHLAWCLVDEKGNPTRWGKIPLALDADGDHDAAVIGDAVADLVGIAK
jgi:hypothetical protein